MNHIKNAFQFLFALMLLGSLPLAVSAQGGGGGPHHGGGNHHHHNDDGPGGGGGGGWNDNDSTEVDTPPSVADVLAHLIEEGLADCLAGVDSTTFASVEELFDYVQANCELPVDTLGVPHHGHGHGHGHGCHTDSLDVDMPTVGEVFAHLLEEGLADCLSGVDSTSFTTIAELFDYVQANCELPADTTGNPGGPHHGGHHGHHGHGGHKVAGAQQGVSGKTTLDTAAGISVSPNPTFKGASVTIRATEPVAMYRVFDMTGKLILSNSANGSQTFELVLGNLTAGVYLVQIQTTSGSMGSQRVIVQ